MRSTQRSLSHEERTLISRRRGLVKVQAMLVAEFDVEVDTFATSDAEHVAAATKKALEGAARKEFDLVALSAARALKRHLNASKSVAGLTVIAKVAGEQPELLVESGASDAEA